MGYPIANRRDAWDDFQEEVGEWADKTFKKSSPETVIKHLRREVEELATAKKPLASAEEVADCVLLLMHYAHKKGFSIYDECVKKHEINQRRKWGKPDKDGVVEHVD